MNNAQAELREAQALVDYLKEIGGYLDVRVLSDGSVAAVGELMFTRAIYLGCNRHGFERRFCYKDRELALKRFHELQTEDDEPTGWIARRPEMPCDRP